MEDAFWDTSSLVPLCTIQTSTEAALALRNQYEMAVWWGTPLEIRGAITREMRMGKISSNGQVQALVKLDELRQKWTEIDPSVAVRDRAEIVIERYQLRAADALQLAAALFWCDGHPRHRIFIAGDGQLLAAAAQAGFQTLTA
jgi:predicted nucleic acid-binding protein